MLITMKYLLIKGHNKSDIKEIGRCLREGQLVALPSDFGYILSFIAARKSFEKFLTVLPAPEKPSVLCSNPAIAQAYVPRIGLQGRKAIKAFWPGKVDFGFEISKKDFLEIQKRFSTEAIDIVYSGNQVFLSCPDVPAVLEIAEQTLAPLVFGALRDGANNTIKNVDYIKINLNSLVDAIVEIEGLKFGSQNHTIVLFGAKGMRVLVEGAVSRSEIVKKATIQILFVCTANTCRSPLAEAFCKCSLCRRFDCSLDRLSEFGYNVLSAGVLAVGNMPASAYSAQIAEEIGCPLDNHRSRQLTEQMVQQADVIWVMSASHRDEVLGRWPAAADKTALLDPKGPIADPIGGDLETYRRCAEQIERAVENRLNEIL